MRTPRVSAHPDLGQIAPLYPHPSRFVLDLAKIVEFGQFFLCLGFEGRFHPYDWPMFKRVGRFALILSLISTYLLQISAPAATAANVTFSQTFTGGSVPAASIFTAWQSFVSQLTGSYGSFTFSSSNGGSITVTDSVKVNQVATALRTRTATTDATFIVTIGANTWQYTPSYYFEFGNNSSGGCGNPAYVIRPTFVNANWGGIGTTCSSLTQTLTLTFTEDAPSASTFSTSQSSPTNIASGSTITYSLVLSQSVSDLATGDFQLGGSSTCSTPGLSGSGTTYTVTLTGCTEGTVILQLKANSVTGTTTTGPTAIASANTIVIDRTAPTITSVSAPANATYIPGNSISFTTNMSETVTVTGTPRLAIVIGSTTRYANYASGSNSRSLIFTYVVQLSTGDIDTDGIVLNTPLELNGGTIVDLATNALSALTITPPTMGNVLVAQKPSAPTIDSISATSGQLAVYFTPGANNGSVLTNYEYSTNNGANWTTRSPVSTTSPLTITGLTNGTSYPVRLRAINAAGSGDSSTAVSATPTAVVVAGGSNISITYGQSASSSQFTATGGTGLYVFTLSSTPAGVSISNAIVSVDSTTAAGTYTLNVIATDNAGSPQSGLKQITITVAKASSSITIALPGSSSTAALNVAVTITATVSKPGSVNFKLGGTSISGCSSATALSTTAACSWIPVALGSVSITALFTPTDSTNYETSTTTTLSITVVNGVSTITLSLTGGTTTPPKGQSINIIASIDQAGRVTFLADGKRIPGCYNVSATVGNKSCSWKPAVQKQVNLTATLTPSNNVYNPSASSLSVWVVRRSGNR